MTINESYLYLKEQLKSYYSSNELTNIINIVFENLLNYKNVDRILNQDKEISKENQIQLIQISTDLKNYKPIQYIFNQTFFGGLKLFVNEHCLIPRPETEELANLVLEELKNNAGKNEPKSVLDIGTGSGCLSIFLAYNSPNQIYTALDISNETLDIARKNAQRYNLSALNFKALDFLNEANWDNLSNFDIIVSNPPYIPENERKNLASNVVDYEPSMALFVDDNTPLIFYQKIIEFSKIHLNQNGIIFVEINQDFYKETLNLFKNNGFTTELIIDIFDNPRIIKAVPHIN